MNTHHLWKKLSLHWVAKVYGFVIAWRNKRFDTGKISINSIAIPVICVGNISTGGTGKTPFTQAILRLLQEHFPSTHPAVVSRGYGRKTRGEIIVSDGVTLRTEDAELCGDEPLLHALAFPTVPVIVHEDRTKGSLLAIQRYKANCIVLDDGFQHRRLSRDIDIVLLDSYTLKHQDLLPLGRLREPRESLRRAAIICFMNGARPREIHHPIYSFIHPESLILEAETHPLGLYNIEGQKISLPQKVCAVSGIANPERFHHSLQTMGFELGGILTFRDHIRYTQRHIETIVRTAKGNQQSIIATTEKDLVKLRRFRHIFAQESLTLAVVPIGCTITHGKEALHQRFEELFAKPISR
ncbi:MAG: tetraacyldisaccharide 4'-kinase [Candidatus Kapaibacteriota bacterium]|jgi:tetraacyldisaccharide 4'-kinase